MYNKLSHSNAEFKKKIRGNTPESRFMEGEERGGESLFSFSENVLNLSYSNAEFTNFPGSNTSGPSFQGGEEAVASSCNYVWLRPWLRRSLTFIAISCFSVLFPRQESIGHPFKHESKSTFVENSVYMPMSYEPRSYSSKQKIFLNVSVQYAVNKKNWIPQLKWHMRRMCFDSVPYLRVDCDGSEFLGIPTKDRRTMRITDTLGDEPLNWNLRHLCRPGRTGRLITIDRWYPMDNLSPLFTCFINMTQPHLDGSNCIQTAWPFCMVLPSGVFRGAIGPWPPLATFFSSYEKIGKHGLAHFCVSTSGQRKFGSSPLWNPTGLLSSRL